MSKSFNDISDDHSESNEQLLSQEVLLAKVATLPNLLAAKTISRFNRAFGNLKLIYIVDELNTQISRVQKGDLGLTEEMLAAQAIVLDTLFNMLAVKSTHASGMVRWFLTFFLIYRAPTTASVHLSSA